MAWSVLIAGGGFGGLFAARALERILPPARRAHHARRRRQLHAVHLAHAGAAGGTLEPRHVVVPLRRELARTEIRLGHVAGADPARKRLLVRCPEAGGGADA